MRPHVVIVGAGFAGLYGTGRWMPVAVTRDLEDQVVREPFAERAHTQLRAQMEAAP